MLQILGRFSSINVRKVLWTCDEIGLRYDRSDWGQGFQSTQAPEFLALNPNALVPVIVEDGGAFVLWESNTICRYLATRHGRRDLLPDDARERAAVEQWMDWQAGELNTAWRYAFLALVRKSPAHADAAAVEASRLAWNRHMQILDAHLGKTGAYAAGPGFTLADVVLGLSTHRWLATPIERPVLPALAAYVERLRGRAGFLQYALKEVP